VVDTTRQRPGKVADFVETGANDFAYLVHGPRGEILVPRSGP
jgi:ribosomal 30S subunit maturation factor RimM